MTPLERSVVDLIRLGLAGDAASVRRYALKLLKAKPGEVDEEESELKGAIARLVVDQSASRKVTRNAPRDVPAVAAPDALALTRVERIEDPVAPALSAEVLRVIDVIVSERQPKSARSLAAQGIEPTRTLLLTGVPGVGKTMTARYLAGALGLPLLSVDLAALISSYLGKTGQNLRRALDHARHHPSVLLLDEFDALGKRRDDPADVGELKRIVNVLLSELERWPSHSLFVAATNHPELLDRAIWRRFDQILVLDLPTSDARREIITRLLEEHGFELPELDLTLSVDATQGLSGSDLTRFVRMQLRSAIIDQVGPHDLPLAYASMVNLMERGRSDDEVEARVRFAGLANEHWRWTQRETAQMLQVSHVTVGKMLKMWHTRREAERLAAPPPTLPPVPAQAKRVGVTKRTTKPRKSRAKS